MEGFAQVERNDVNGLYDEIHKVMDDLRLEMDKFVEKHNKAAGRRSRKATLTLEKLFKQWRKATVEASK
jgi:hypothetical protein